MAVKYFRKRPARAAAMRAADEARDSRDPARAATLYEAVVERWGPSFGVLVQLGNALKDSGSYERAEQVYLSALEIEPQDADCYLQLGHLMKLWGKSDRAEDYYREANRLNPDLPGAVAELKLIEEAKMTAPENPRDPPVSVQVVDKWSRSVVTRKRLISSFAWRRG
jgi:tetratricopeptide (TPR) repeat protein